MTGFEGAGIHVELARRLLRWNRASQRVSSGILGYGLSVASVAMAVGAALTLQHYDFRAPPTAVFTLAIAIAAWYGGIGPAVVAVLLSITCFVYFFTAPFYSFEISAREIPYTLVFVVWAPIVAWFSLAARRIADELRQAYDRLRLEVEQRREQARLLDQTHDSIFFRDMNGVISYWNRGAQELFGWSAEEAIGKRSHELLRTVFPTSLADIEEVLRRTGVWEGELRHTKADGSQVISASRWSLRRDDQGRPLLIMATNNDITERKRGEDEIRRLNQELARRAAELESANKELELFAYSVSHDLRAPLRHVVGFSELLQARASSSVDEKSRHYIQTICGSARRMGDLIDDLLAFSPNWPSRNQVHAGRSGATRQGSRRGAPTGHEGTRDHLANRRASGLPGRSIHAAAGHRQPALERGQIHASCGSRPKSRSAVPSDLTRSSCSSGTMARASTCSMSASSSASSSGCIRWSNSKAPGSASPPFSA